jgi:hypothetical protein
VMRDKFFALGIENRWCVGRICLTKRTNRANHLIETEELRPGGKPYRAFLRAASCVALGHAAMSYRSGGARAILKVQGMRPLYFGLLLSIGAAWSAPQRHAFRSWLRRRAVGKMLAGKSWHGLSLATARGHDGALRGASRLFLTMARAGTAPNAECRTGPGCKPALRLAVRCVASATYLRARTHPRRRYPSDRLMSSP